MATVPSRSTLEVHAPAPAGADDILTPDALKFVEALVHEFGPTRDALLRARVERQRALDAGDSDSNGELCVWWLSGQIPPLLVTPAVGRHNHRRILICHL